MSSVYIGFSLAINLGNDAMPNEFDTGVADALEDVANQLRNGRAAGNVLDRNGNTVGVFAFHDGNESFTQLRKDGWHGYNL